MSQTPPAGASPMPGCRLVSLVTLTNSNCDVTKNKTSKPRTALECISSRAITTTVIIYTNIGHPLLVSSWAPPLGSTALHVLGEVSTDKNETHSDGGIQFQQHFPCPYCSLSTPPADFSEPRIFVLGGNRKQELVHINCTVKPWGATAPTSPFDEY